MHFGDISSDHVTRNAYAARNNEAWGPGKVITIKVVMIQDTKLQPLMTNATTSCGQARSRGRGRGGSSPPPEIFRLELNFATTVEFFY